MSTGTLSATVSEEIAKVISEHCWRQRITRSEFLRTLVEGWVAEQREKGEMLDEDPADATLEENRPSSP